MPEDFLELDMNWIENFTEISQKLVNIEKISLTFAKNGKNFVKKRVN